MGSPPPSSVIRPLPLHPRVILQSVLRCLSLRLVTALSNRTTPALAGYSSEITDHELNSEYFLAHLTNKNGSAKIYSISFQTKFSWACCG